MFAHLASVMPTVYDVEPPRPGPRVKLAALARSYVATGLPRMRVRTSFSQEWCLSLTELRLLVKFGSLRQIAIDKPSRVTDSCLRALATAAPNLTVLHITYASDVTSAGLAYLATLTQLQDLRLGNVNLAIFLQVGDAEPQFPRVRIVVLASTGIGTGIPHVKFNDQGVAMCGSKVMTPTALRSLAELRSRRNFLDAPASETDSCMRALAATAPNLTVLRVEDAFDVTSAGLAYLAKLTKLQDLQLDGVNWRGLDPRLAEGLCSWLATLVDLQELALKDCSCLDGGYLRAITRGRGAVVTAEPRSDRLPAS